MNFYPIVSAAENTAELASEYKGAREIGKIRIGDSYLFCRNGLKTYYIPYSDVHRCFRRVLEVPVRNACIGGDFSIENIVVCGEGDVELLQVQLPGAKAAKITYEELKTRIPHAKFGKPGSDA